MTYIVTFDCTRCRASDLVINFKQDSNSWDKCMFLQVWMPYWSCVTWSCHLYTHLLDNKGVIFILGFALVNIHEVLRHLLYQNLVTHFPAKIMVIKVNYFLVRIVNFSSTSPWIYNILIFTNDVFFGFLQTNKKWVTRFWLCTGELCSHGHCKAN